jgi:aromatic ring-opening dioxygenase catalytic subunit (LigB family)
MPTRLQAHRLPTVYIPHGGGPCFFMDWTMGPADTWEKMKHWLMQLGDVIKPEPEAIIVISAHWEAQPVAIINNSQPPLIYDYYGFPEHTYQLKYPAPGLPSLAEKIQALFSATGINSTMDSKRGNDHGVFIPLLIIYPDAHIPIVQISLNVSLDPAAHILMGRALEPLRSEGVLIIGSGMSYHNMNKLMRRDKKNLESDRFDAWLTETCLLTSAEREKQLCQWSKAPAARDAHPREEHLLPLMVVAGAAGADRGVKTYTDRVMGATVSAYQFG